MAKITTERGAYSADLYVYADDVCIGIVWRTALGSYNAQHQYGSSVLPRMTTHGTEESAFDALTNGFRAE